MKRVLLPAAWTWCAGVLLSVGCAQSPSRPPQTLSELEAHRRAGGQEFTNRMIALHNARLAASNECSPERRLESLKVVEKVDSPEYEVYPVLATVLSDPKAPPQVRSAVLGLLARKGFPDLADHVAAALPQAGDALLRSALLSWLEGNPANCNLGDVVKLWAAEKTHSDEMETRYRRIVERVGGKAWDESLLEALNTANFTAPGSAIEVLIARVRPEQLRRRIIAVKAQTYVVRALQYLADAFAYVPRSRRELTAAVHLYRTGSDRLHLAAELADRWRADGGYQFNIRDFHLLSQLAADPLRKPMSRQALSQDLSRAIAARRGLTRNPNDPTWRQRVFRRGRLVDFDSQVESLSLADLWNLYLVNEMFNRQRMREAFAAVIRNYRQKKSSDDGLIVYDQGQADAKLYEPDAARSDEAFMVGKAMLDDAFTALCCFVGHFEQDVTNPSWIGPTKGELDFAREWNLSGVVLTSLEGGKIDVMYFNPDGIVIDLGEFPTK